MKTKLFTAIAVAFSTTAVPAFAQDVVDLGAVTTVGASSAHDKVVTAKTHKPSTYGVFVDHGNKMTVKSGVIYDLGVGINRGKADGLKYSNMGVQGQAGYRVSVAESLSIDVLGGLEYSSFKVTTLSGEGNYKTPTVKAGVGANYFASSDTSLRAEVGYAYNFQGTLKDKSTGRDYDLKGAGSPYIELSVLNTSFGLPIFASVYRTKTAYKFDYSDSTIKDSQTETGLKIGLAF